MKKVLLTLLFILSLFLMSGCRNEYLEGEYKFYNAGSYQMGNASFEKDIYTIRIDWLVGDIIIDRSLTDEVIIKEEVDDNIKDNLKMQYCYNEKELDIKFCGYQLHINHRYKTKKLYLYLPANSIRSNIYITNKSANIKVRNIDENSLTIINQSGDIDVKFVFLQDLKITNEEGDVSVLNNSAKNVMMDSKDGDVTFSYSKMPEKVKINIIDGLLKIYFAKQDSVGLEFNKEYGNYMKVKTNLEFTQFLNRLYLNDGDIIFYIKIERAKVKLLKK